jgi:hypothetical protein
VMGTLRRPRMIVSANSRETFLMETDLSLKKIYSE